MRSASRDGCRQESRPIAGTQVEEKLYNGQICKQIVLGQLKKDRFKIYFVSRKGEVRSTAASSLVVVIYESYCQYARLIKPLEFVFIEFSTR